MQLIDFQGQLVEVIAMISVADGALTFKGISNNINILSVLLFLGGYIIQGMAEEVMCRGYLMTSLLRKTSMIWAVFLSSLVFTFLHLSSLLTFGVESGTIGFVNTMLFSVFVSVFMINGKNIWITCAIHSSWNFILGVLCGISVSGGEAANASIFTFIANDTKRLINGGLYGVEAGIITTAILTICIAILIFTIKRKNNKVN